MRLDRRCWARAIYTEICIWGFKGIANLSPRDMLVILDGHRTRKKSLYTQIVLADEAFMDNLHHEEVKYVATSEDYQNEWEEHVKRDKHREGCCPHGTDVEREAYQRVVTSTTNNVDKRYKWAYDHVDTDQMENYVSHFFDGEEGLFYFVKDYPVDSVWQRYCKIWLDLDAVRGYCPYCGDPITENERWNPEEVDVHPYDKDCRRIVCGDGAAMCLFDVNGKPRDVYECGVCDWADATCDIDGNKTFISIYGRPFNWPPGAPYPPRRSFSGSPMDVPPYED